MTTSPSRIARVMLIVAIALIGLYIAWAFVPALLWAVILAVAIDPLVQRAEAGSTKPRPSLIAGGFTLAFAAIVLVPIALGIAQAIRESQAVMLWVHEARHHGVPPPGWFANLPAGNAELTAWWRTNLTDPTAANAHFETVSHALLGAQSQLIGVGVLHGAVIFGFTLTAFFFLVQSRDSIVAQARIASHKLLGPQGERIGVQALASVRGTIDGLVLVGIGVGAVMTIVYWLLGIPHPIMLGVLTAIAAMIPFGPAIAFAIAAFLALTEGSIGAAIAVVVIGFAVEFVAGHFIRPVLIGSATRLPFLWVLIGILGGVETMGILGLFIGPAAMAVLVMLWRELVEGVPDAPAEPVA